MSLNLIFIFGTTEIYIKMVLGCERSTFSTEEYDNRLYIDRWHNSFILNPENEHLNDKNQTNFVPDMIQNCEEPDSRDQQGFSENPESKFFENKTRNYTTINEEANNNQIKHKYYNERFQNISPYITPNNILHNTPQNNNDIFRHENFENYNQNLSPNYFKNPSTPFQISKPGLGFISYPCDIQNDFLFRGNANQPQTKNFRSQNLQEQKNCEKDSMILNNFYNPVEIFLISNNVMGLMDPKILSGCSILSEKEVLTNTTQANEFSVTENLKSVNDVNKQYYQEEFNICSKNILALNPNSNEKNSGFDEKVKFKTTKKNWELEESYKELNYSNTVSFLTHIIPIYKRNFKYKSFYSIPQSKIKSRCVFIYDNKGSLSKNVFIPVYIFSISNPGGFYNHGSSITNEGAPKHILPGIKSNSDCLLNITDNTNKMGISFDENEGKCDILVYIFHRHQPIVQLGMACDPISNKIMKMWYSLLYYRMKEYKNLRILEKNIKEISLLICLKYISTHTLIKNNTDTGERNHIIETVTIDMNFDTDPKIIFFMFLEILGTIFLKKCGFDNNICLFKELNRFFYFYYNENHNSDSKDLFEITSKVSCLLGYKENNGISDEYVNSYFIGFKAVMRE